eukprot:scaffold67732_cov18-Tisochrysis_lutea.AAC.1
MAIMKNLCVMSSLFHQPSPVGGLRLPSAACMQACHYNWTYTSRLNADFAAAGPCLCSCHLNSANNLAVEGQLSSLRAGGPQSAGSQSGLHQLLDLPPEPIELALNLKPLGVFRG